MYVRVCAQEEAPQWDQAMGTQGHVPVPGKGWDSSCTHGRPFTAVTV